MQRHKNKSENKKHTRLPIRAYLSYLLAATVVFTGVTFSKYVATSSAGDSARVAKFGGLELTEPDAPENNEYIIAPGVDIAKKPLVSFGVLEKSETAAYVFVSVNAPGWQHDNGIYKVIRESDGIELLSWSVDEGFTPLDGEQVFYRAVPANEFIKEAPVISGNVITVSDKLYGSDYEKLDAAAKSITFKSYAVQAGGFENAKAAWASVSGG